MAQISTSTTTTTVSLDGDLDLAARDTFDYLVAQVRGMRRRDLVVDMCRVDFMDSSGTSFLMALAAAARQAGGSVRMRGLHERDRFVLEVCGALPLFDLEEGHRCEPTSLERARA